MTNPKGTPTTAQRTSRQWQEYAVMKNEWVRKNPEASNQEIDKASRRILLMLGL